MKILKLIAENNYTNLFFGTGILLNKKLMLEFDEGIFDFIE